MARPLGPHQPPWRMDLFGSSFNMSPSEQVSIKSRGQSGYTNAQKLGEIENKWKNVEAMVRNIVRVVKRRMRERDKHTLTNKGS